MAQTINPNSFRLGSKLTWWSVAHYNIRNTSLNTNGYQIFHNDLLIRKYVEHIFNNFNILVSEIIISRRHTTLALETPDYFSTSTTSTWAEKMGGKVGNKKKDLRNVFNKIKNTNKIKNNKINLLNSSLSLYQPAISMFKLNKGDITDHINLTLKSKLEKENISLEFLVYIQNNNDKDLQIRSISIFIKKFLENILNNKSNKYNIIFNIKEVPNPANNVKILSSWIGQELSNNPRRHKAVIKKALYMINSNKKLN